MTLANLVSTLISRGFASVTVTRNSPHAVYPKCDVALTVTTAQGVNVPWPNVAVSKSDNISDVSFGAFHGGKVTGFSDNETAAIYGDIYMAHNGRPSQAEKAIAALLATPAVTRTPIIEYNPELDPAVQAA